MINKIDIFKGNEWYNSILILKEQDVRLFCKIFPKFGCKQKMLPTRMKVFLDEKAIRDDK